MPRRWRRFALILLILLAPFLLAIFVTPILIGTAPTGPPESIEDLQALGDNIIAQLETHRTKHGAYPSSLESAAIDNPSAHFGHFKYHHDQAGDYFILAIGDYGRDDFEASFDSRKATWYIDI